MYVTLSSILNPTTGVAATASWGDQINDNFEAIRATGPKIVTSGTRPASPSPGDHIYETDTGQQLVYYGATTGWRRPWPNPWGNLGRTGYALSHAGLGASAGDLSGVSVTYTAVANRLTKVTLQCRVLQNTSAGVNELYIANGSNVVQNKSSVSLAAAAAYTHHVTAIVTPAAGVTVFKARLSTTAGTTDTVLSSTQQAEIIVEDIGPVGSIPAS